MKKFLAALAITLLSLFAAPVGLVGAQTTCPDGSTVTPPATCPSPTATANTNKTAVCEGVGFAGGAGSCDPGTQDSFISGVVSSAINLISIVVGIISVIMIIIGGLKYIMSMGDPNNINSAKNTILYAIIGLVVVALAQIIVRFVISKV
jgi:hypothetical protein